MKIFPQKPIRLDGYDLQTPLGKGNIRRLEVIKMSDDCTCVKWWHVYEFICIIMAIASIAIPLVLVKSFQGNGTFAETFMACALIVNGFAWILPIIDKMWQKSWEH